MIDIARAHEILDTWFQEKQVGNIIFSHSHNRPEIIATKERVIKVREMPEDIGDLVSVAFSALDCDKAELFRNSDGECDRVKVARGLK